MTELVEKKLQINLNKVIEIMQDLKINLANHIQKCQKCAKLRNIPIKDRMLQSIIDHVNKNHEHKIGN